MDITTHIHTFSTLKGKPCCPCWQDVPYNSLIELPVHMRSLNSRTASDHMKFLCEQTQWQGCTTLGSAEWGEVKGKGKKELIRTYCSGTYITLWLTQSASLQCICLRFYKLRTLNSLKAPRINWHETHDLTGNVSISRWHECVDLWVWCKHEACCRNVTSEQEH